MSPSVVRDWTTTAAAVRRDEVKARREVKALAAGRKLQAQNLALQRHLANLGAAPIVATSDAWHEPPLSRDSEKGLPHGASERARHLLKNRYPGATTAGSLKAAETAVLERADTGASPMLVAALRHRAEAVRSGCTASELKASNDSLRVSLKETNRETKRLEAELRMCRRTRQGREQAPQPPAELLRARNELAEKHVAVLEIQQALVLARHRPAAMALLSHAFGMIHSRDGLRNLLAHWRHLSLWSRRPLYGNMDDLPSVPADDLIESAPTTDQPKTLTKPSALLVVPKVKQFGKVTKLRRSRSPRKEPGVPGQPLASSEEIIGPRAPSEEVPGQPRASSEEVPGLPAPSEVIANPQGEPGKTDIGPNPNSPNTKAPRRKPRKGPAGFTTQPVARPLAQEIQTEDPDPDPDPDPNDGPGLFQGIQDFGKWAIGADEDAGSSEEIDIWGEYEDDLEVRTEKATETMIQLLGEEAAQKLRAAQARKKRRQKKQQQAKANHGKESAAASDPIPSEQQPAKDDVTVAVTPEVTEEDDGIGAFEMLQAFNPWGAADEDLPRSSGSSEVFNVYGDDDNDAELEKRKLEAEENLKNHAGQTVVRRPAFVPKAGARDRAAARKQKRAAK